MTDCLDDFAACFQELRFDLYDALPYGQDAVQQRLYDVGQILFYTISKTDEQLFSGLGKFWGKRCDSRRERLDGGFQRFKDCRCFLCHPLSDRDCNPAPCVDDVRQHTEDSGVELLEHIRCRRSKCFCIISNPVSQRFDDGNADLYHLRYEAGEFSEDLRECAAESVCKTYKAAFLQGGGECLYYAGCFVCEFGKPTTHRIVCSNSELSDGILGKLHLALECSVPLLCLRGQSGVFLKSVIRHFHSVGQDIARI